MTAAPCSQPAREDQHGSGRLHLLPDGPTANHGVYSTLAMAGINDPVPALVSGCRAGIRRQIARGPHPRETRWPALQKTDIGDLFSVALLSHALGIRKPEPRFCRLVLTAELPPDQVLFVGGNLRCNADDPLARGMRAAPVRPDGLRPGEALSRSALLIRHVRDIPALLEAA